MGRPSLLLFACGRVFVAPGNTLDLLPKAGAQQGRPNRQSGPLTTHQISLLQGWAARHRLPWRPINAWLETAGALTSDASGTEVAPARPVTAANDAVATADNLVAAGNNPVATTQPAGVSNAGAGTQPATVQLAPAPAGTAPAPFLRLHGDPAKTLDDVLAALGLQDAWVITWPDPIAKSTQQMQRVFRTADDLVKQTNDAIAMARQLDPRAHRYELHEVSRQYTTRAISGASQPTDPRVMYEQTDTVSAQNLFADGGASWRNYTDGCLAQVRKAIDANRNLYHLVARFPEINIDANEVSQSYETLDAWRRQASSREKPSESAVARLTPR